MYIWKNNIFLRFCFRFFFAAETTKNCYLLSQNRAEII